MFYFRKWNFDFKSFVAFIDLYQSDGTTIYHTTVFHSWLGIEYGAMKLLIEPDRRSAEDHFAVSSVLGPAFSETTNSMCHLPWTFSPYRIEEISWKNTRDYRGNDQRHEPKMEYNAEQLSMEVVHANPADDHLPKSPSFCSEMSLCLHRVVAMYVNWTTDWQVRMSPTCACHLQ